MSQEQIQIPKGWKEDILEDVMEIIPVTGKKWQVWNHSAKWTSLCRRNCSQDQAKIARRIQSAYNNSHARDSF